MGDVEDHLTPVVPTWVFPDKRARVLELFTSKTTDGTSRFRPSVTMWASWGPGPNRG